MKYISKNKKILKVLIFGLIVAAGSVFILSCDNNSDGGLAPPPAFESDGGSELTENIDPSGETAEILLYSDDLPDFDYGGAKFRMLTFDDYPAAHSMLVIEEQTGEIVNDSIYLANRIVQDRFNLEFEQIEGQRLNMPYCIRV